MGSTSEGSLLQETRLLSDKILETAHVLKTVMMRVSTLEKKMESLREENLSEKLKNKHLNAELARERKHSQEQQRRQSQLPNHHQNTNPDDDGEVDDVKTLVMMRRAAGNASTGTTTTTTTTPNAVPRLHNEHQKNKIVDVQTPTAPIPTTTTTTNALTPHDSAHTTSARIPKIAKKKERTFAPNDPRRDAYAARVPAQTITNRVPSIDTSVDTSAEEKKRQLKKEVVEREREERASKKAKTRDDNSSDDDDDALAVKFQKRPAKKEKKKQKKGEQTAGGTVKLSEQEEHHLKYGHGRRGVRVDTVQGPAYFALDDDQLLGIGDRVNVHPLTLYSLFRWDQPPELSLRSRLLQGTRLFLAPSEDWEFDYIREDELKAITKMCEKISKASPELCFDDANVRALKNKVQELSKNKDKESADHYFVSLPFYRAVKEIIKNQSATKDHLERAEKKFAQLWQAAGFLEPERNAATVRSFEEQRKAFEDLIQWNRDGGK